MRGNETRKAVRALVAVLAIAAWAGCGGQGTERPDAAESDEAEAVLERLAEDTAPEVGTGDPATGEEARRTGPDPASHTAPEIPGATPLPGEQEEELRRYRLLLVNGTEVDAVVFASAGADRVVLDTVLQGDSIRVDVEVRSRWLRLEASDDRGVELGGEEVEPGDEGVFRWRVSGRTPPGS